MLPVCNSVLVHVQAGTTRAGHHTHPLAQLPVTRHMPLLQVLRLVALIQLLISLRTRCFHDCAGSFQVSAVTHLQLHCTRPLHSVARQSASPARCGGSLGGSLAGCGFLQIASRKSSNTHGPTNLFCLPISL